MIILTGNDLKSGAVTWWTGTHWSIHIEDAVDVGESDLDARDPFVAVAGDDFVGGGHGRFRGRAGEVSRVVISP